ncbi:hypothetical protein FY150_25215 (plasmid) [Agrobacterium tumefaciens]|nr:hypothetical protein FY150_25215 [Agrobacterium tumefaciens]
MSETADSVVVQDDKSKPAKAVPINVRHAGIGLFIQIPLAEARQSRLFELNTLGKTPGRNEGPAFRRSGVACYITD